MTLRRRLARTFAAALIVVAACISVGLTSPAGGPFTIKVRPVFLRLDDAAVAESRAGALGLEVDIKLGAAHLHFGWSAISLAELPAPSTPGCSTLL
jgi:hypothetical protein